MPSSVFALEVAVRLENATYLQTQLRGAIVDQQASLGHDAKWRAYRHAATAILGHLPHVERGCWDYFDEHERAERDFAMWLGGMTTEEGARPSPSGAPDPYRSEPRYMTFTMALLIVNPSPTDAAMRRLCDVPEPHLWHRRTFARILDGLGVVSFASVKSDVMYLIPRDLDWSLTAQDLAAEKFNYLRPLL